MNKDQELALARLIAFLVNRPKIEKLIMEQSLHERDSLNCDVAELHGLILELEDREKK